MRKVGNCHYSCPFYFYLLTFSQGFPIVYSFFLLQEGKYSWFDSYISFSHSWSPIPSSCTTIWLSSLSLPHSYLSAHWISYFLYHWLLFLRSALRIILDFFWVQKIEKYFRLPASLSLPCHRFSVTGFAITTCFQFEDVNLSPKHFLGPIHALLLCFSLLKAFTRSNTLNYFPRPKKSFSLK